MQIYDIIGNSYTSVVQKAMESEKEAVSPNKGLFQPRMGQSKGTKRDEAERIADYVKMIRAKRKALNG